MSLERPPGAGQLSTYHTPLPLALDTTFRSKTQQLRFPNCEDRILLISKSKNTMLGKHVRKEKVHKAM